MAEYIDQEAFVGKYREVYCQDCDRRKGVKNGRMQFLYDVGDAPCRACDIGDMLDAADDFPAADVVEVVHGEWIPVTNGRGGSECNLCHAYAPSYQSGAEYKSPYCPNCGAKMDGGADNG